MTPREQASLSETEIERRVTVLIAQARTVLTVFRGGYNPTEAQLSALEGACLNLDALKVCGHTIREDCHCE